MNKSTRDFQESKVIQIKSIAEGAYLLSFKRSFLFLPGQVLELTLSLDEDPRYYSIASSSLSDTIEILFDIKPEGSLSPRLAVLAAGDIIYHSLPSGCFLSTDEPAVWIAAGTGIAPFRSMLLSGLNPATQLIYGARRKENLYFHDDLVKVFGKQYIPCCSREKVSGAYYGRITQFLMEMPVIYPDKLYYLCGSAEMVVDSREILLEKGIPYGNIIAEIYF